MISEKIKSLIRHALTALGTVMMLLGLGEWTEAINFLSEQYETIIAAIEVIGGAIIMLFGFFKTEEKVFKEQSRFKTLEAAKK